MILGVAGGMPGDARWYLGLRFGGRKVAEAGGGSGLITEGVLMGGASSSARSGDSKSQTTPCFVQFPHLGCTSSHFIRRLRQQTYSVTVRDAVVGGHLGTKGDEELETRQRESHTLILRTLHLLHPARDFLCDLRGGMTTKKV